MLILLVFAISLFVAVLFSELSDRSMLSTAVVFLFAGFLTGKEMLGFLPLTPAHPLVATLAEMALFAVLFTDGMRVGVRDLASAWRLPGRALVLGMPLTFLLTAALAHWIAGLPWVPSFLVGAVLSPTDPVFASAIVGREEIPWRLRHLLNVESGLNDGLALPVVLALLAALGEHSLSAATLSIELLGGIALGVVLPWVATLTVRSGFFGVTHQYEPLFGVSIGLLVYSICALTHLNAFLAAFSAGITLASVSPKARERFHKFGETFAELLKLGALMVFGTLISPRFLGEIHWTGYVFALSVLVVARSATLLPALIGSELNWPERLTAAWFGPKGFASVVYGLLILKEGIAGADEMFHLIALAIAASIIAHSSTDVPLARWFREADAREKKAAAQAAA